ncbi:sensor histidine kinase [Pseudonocardia adelaidensis]|uniref:Signal transduction histidine kinase subgroup 3 dimerisation and phosphoacceptor domain-containing protein n=1 Tax=Pseudonocardia adelaidensis TaxID=648754 RepID=A0ABP9NWM3_9PSEU
MQAQRSTAPSGQGSDPSLGRLGLLAPVFLAGVLLARASYPSPHPDFSHVPFVVAVFVLPFWYVSGVGRAVWARWYVALLALQSVVTFAPFALFGAGWPGGVTGPLGGLLLLTLRTPRNWVLFVVAAAADLAVRFAVGLPEVNPDVAPTWVLIAYADSGIALYGLVRLSEMAAALHATRSDLVDAAVAHQRLAGAQRLRAAVVDRLDEVLRCAALALSGVDTAPGRARRELERAGRIVRDAAAEIRRNLPAGPPDPSGDPVAQRTGVLAPRIARFVLLATLVMFGVLNVLNVAYPDAGVPVPSPPVVLAAVVVSAAIVLLQWRHSAAGTRPRGWRWTFALQAVLTYAFYPFVGSGSMTLVAFLAGSALLLLAPRLRWAGFAAAVLSMPTLVAVAPLGPLPLLAWVLWTGYVAGVAAAWGLVVYGLSRLTGVVAELVEARAELAELATVREQLRIARDTHDLLGLGLSAIALKTDIAAALLATDPGRARHEIGELLAVAAATREDAGAVPTRPPRPALATELRTAAEILRWGGIEVRGSLEAPPLPAEVDAALATVLREAVTNVLRHSRPTRVELDVTVAGAGVGLTVRSDGACPQSDGPGQGLANLRDRLAAIDGSLQRRHTDGRFVLEAAVPLPVAAGSLA